MTMHHPFSFEDTGGNTISGRLILSDQIVAEKAASYREGSIELDSGNTLAISLTHSTATGAFIYTHSHEVTHDFFTIFGLPLKKALAGYLKVVIPGQLIIGSERTRFIGQGVKDSLQAPCVKKLMAGSTWDGIVTIPVLREGIKYQVAEAIYDIYGYYSDEVVTDAHHTHDESAGSYKRGVAISIFKDADISEHQRNRVQTVFIGDSIASGTVLIGVVKKVCEQFRNVQRIEVVAPFATLRGLARIAHYCPPQVQVRAHVFETLLNALPPDYYFSAHFVEPGFHIRPDLQNAYEDWWGIDAEGNQIADTACAGYGWSEAIFAPRRHVEMINGELQARHNLTIAQILERNMHEQLKLL